VVALRCASLRAQHIPHRGGRNTLEGRPDRHLVPRPGRERLRPLSTPSPSGTVCGNHDQLDISGFRRRIAPHPTLPRSREPSPNPPSLTPLCLFLNVRPWQFVKCNIGTRAPLVEPLQNGLAEWSMPAREDRVDAVLPTLTRTPYALPADPTGRLQPPLGTHDGHSGHAQLLGDQGLRPAALRREERAGLEGLEHGRVDARRAPP
jgi:hypothetical protein